MQQLTTTSLQAGDPFCPWKRFVGSFTPESLERSKDISRGAKDVWSRLARYVGKDRDWCKPKQEDLARDVACSTRQVRRYLSELRAAGLLEVQRRGLNLSNVYRLLAHPMLWSGTGNSQIPQDGTTVSALERTEPSALDRTALAAPPLENQEVENQSVSLDRPTEEETSAPAPERNTEPGELTEEQAPEQVSRVWTPEQVEEVRDAIRAYGSYRDGLPVLATDELVKACIGAGAIHLQAPHAVVNILNAKLRYVIRHKSSWPESPRWFAYIVRDEARKLTVAACEAAERMPPQRAATITEAAPVETAESQADVEFSWCGKCHHQTYQTDVEECAWCHSRNCRRAVS